MPKLIESSPVSSQFDKKRIPPEGVVSSQDQGAACEGTTKSAEDSSVLQQFVGKSNLPESITERKVSASFAEDMWQPVSTLTAKENHGCPAASRPSLGQPQPINKCPAQVIDLERNADNDTPSFCSYANRKHDELLRPLPNGPSMMPSYRLRQSGLHFLAANDSLSESDQLQHQFQERQSLVEQNQARGKELYIHQVMNKNVYPNREFLAQRHFSSTDVQDFSALPSSLNDRMTRRSWFVDDRRPSNGWLGFELSSSDQNFGDAGTPDGSLLSVLSECRKLPSRSSYTETRNLEQFIQEGNSTGAKHIHGFAAWQLNSSTVSEATMVPPTLDNTDL
ncbi:hypothetical protein J5N97_022149 [Dioscorea zingiberensis]|uniref:Uncharacterized protein n=1 Tax=Dioscorea zingiberensis TaxID=325984 RepID=A0A9D5HAJ4_9LILI|nr:hypothetical protein J5N97_022149 [Dioscorea zingiberensis]